MIGRDLVRLLQNVARIPEFELLWKDIIHNPQALSPQFTGEGGRGIRPLGGGRSGRREASAVSWREPARRAEPNAVSVGMTELPRGPGGSQPALAQRLQLSLLLRKGARRTGPPPPSPPPHPPLPPLTPAPSGCVAQEGTGWPVCSLAEPSRGVRGQLVSLSQHRAGMGPQGEAPPRRSLASEFQGSSRVGISLGAGRLRVPPRGAPCRFWHTSAHMCGRDGRARTARAQQCRTWGVRRGERTVVH